MKQAIFAFVFLVFFVACQRKVQPVNNAFSLSMQWPDTTKPIIITTLDSLAFPGIFEAAYNKETTASSSGNLFHFYPLTIGKLRIETGKLIAGDPIVMKDLSAFTENFPVGEFPVQLAIAKTNDDERVAFASIIFSDAKVLKWEFALKQGQKPLPINDTSFYCYGVDAGMAIFADSMASKSFSEKDNEEWQKVFIDNANSTLLHGFIHEFDGQNFATFTTGYGDGCYSTYIGLDKHGNICRLLTDFGLITWWH